MVEGLDVTCRRLPTGTWLLWPKALYFVLNFCVYSSYHFFFKYVRERYSVSDTVYGLINTLSAVSFLSSIFWTTLADRTQRHTAILSGAAAAYALSFCMMWMGEQCFRGTSQAARNAFVAVCFLLTNVFISALYPILDSRIMTLLSQQSTDNLSKDLYGRQRLWGCVGQAAVAIVASRTITAFGFPGMFLTVLLSTALFVVCVWILQHKHFSFGDRGKDSKNSVVLQPDTPPDNSNSNNDNNNNNSNNNPGKITPAAPPRSPFVQLITHPRFLMLLFLVFVGGVTRAIVGTYLQQFLERHYSVDIEDFALMTTTRVLTEIGAFLVGKPLIKRWGPGTLLVFGILAGLLRVGWYGFMPSDRHWVHSVPYVELLKGINAAFIVVGGTRIAHDIAPRGAEATAQGFFSGIHGNLSNSFSGLFGSTVIGCVGEGRDSPALRILFRISTLMSLASALLYSLYISLKSK